MRKILLISLAGLGCLIGVLLFRANQFEWQPKPNPPKVKLDLDANAVAQRLSEALKIRTITRSSTLAFEPDSFRKFHALLERNYPRTHQSIEKRNVNEHSLLFRWPGSNPKLKPILLMAHQDVVPVPDEELPSWTHPPFDGVIEDGFIWGRGTLDVKSGVVGILEAVENLIKEDFKPQRTIYLAFGHDEEIGGVFGAKAIADLLAEEKIEFEFVLDEGGSITEGIIPGVDDPVAMVGIAEKGFLSLELSVATEGGHSSMPSKTLAVEILSRAITTLYDHPFPAHAEHALTFFKYVAPKMAFSKRVIFANSWLFSPLIESKLSETKAMNATLRTTIAPTMFHAGVKDNVLPTSARAVVNFRISPGESIESVQKYVREVIDDDRIKIRPFGEDKQVFASNPSSVSSATNHSFAVIEKSIRAVTQDPNMVVAPYIVLGATDSRYFTKLSPNVYRFLYNRLKKGELKLIHGINERISVENYNQTVRFYYQLLKNAQTP